LASQEAFDTLRKALKFGGLIGSDPNVPPRMLLSDLTDGSTYTLYRLAATA